MQYKYNRDDVLRYIQENPQATTDDVCNTFQMSARHARRLRRQAGSIFSSKPTGKNLESKVTESASELSIYLPNTRIKTLQQLVEAYNVDTNIWKVDTWEANKWEVGAKNNQNKIEVTELYQVKAKFKRQHTQVLLNEIRNDFIESLKGASAPPKHVLYRNNMVRMVSKDRCLLEVAVFDAHFGKLCWKEESGEDYDLDISISDYLDAVRGLLVMAQHYNVQRILFPIGNDMLNIDNKGKTTTAGTPQDVDSRFPKIFRTVWETLTYVIDELLLPIAPVDIVVVPGNHDTESSFALGEVLQAYYRQTKTVTVNNNASSRKYYSFGKNLIGFAHGDKAKADALPLLMASERPDLWAASKHREIHIGHWHKHAVNEYNGTVVRTVKALSATDAWHSENGYVGNARGAEAFVFDAEKGLVANLNHVIKRKNE